MGSYRTFIYRHKYINGIFMGEIMKELNFSYALERLENILKHTKNFEFDFGSNHYDYVDLIQDIESTKQACRFAQENYLAHSILIKEIIDNLEIENVLAKANMQLDFYDKFGLGDWHTIKLFGKEIKVSGYHYLDILDWKLKQEKRISNDQEL